MEIKLTDATLATISDGELEHGFQGALVKAAQEVFNDVRPWQLNGNDVVVEVNMKVFLMLDTTTNTLRTAAGVDFKYPKKKMVTRPIHRRGATYFVSEDPEQMPLLVAKKQPATLRMQDAAPTVPTSEGQTKVGE